MWPPCPPAPISTPASLRQGLCDGEGGHKSSFLLLFKKYFRSTITARRCSIYNSDENLGEDLTCQQGRRIIKEAKRSFLEYALKVDKSEGNRKGEGGCAFK